MRDQRREDWQQVFALFERWQTTPAAQREELVTRIRKHSPGLYPQFAAMLQADAGAEAQGFMAQDAVSQVRATVTLPTQWANVRLGPWVLREPLGEGGMGQVWLATRADNLYTGRAAVKLMHMAHLSAEANARFAREGEFLARLTHPRIAQLYDAGLTADGTRYLVLEHVPGEPLDQACDRQSLSIEARLQLFLQVCEAVSYAHLQRVVHRDLKPSNILVTADGHVKLLDFGVAKIMSDAAGDIEATQLGSQWLTVDYAAPEQFDHGSITTATDVYSLGVVLFRLLSGAKPLEGVSSLSDAIRNLDQPRRSMLTAFDQGDSTALAAQRSSTVTKMRQALRGDLATIVAKCLKAEPSERYDTAQALSDDLRRYLAHEPLRARPDSWSYRTRKLIERNRIQALAGVLVVASLVVGISVSWWQRRNAVQEAERTHTVLGVLTGLFKQLTPEEIGTSQVTVVELLSRGWQQVTHDAKGDPELKAELAQPLGLMLVSMGDFAVASEALAVSRQHLLETGQTHSRDYLDVVLNLGYARARMGHSTEAKQLFNEVLSTAAAMDASDSEAPIYAHIQLGIIDRASGQLQQAQSQLKIAAEAAKQRFGESHSAYVLAQRQLHELASEQGRSSDQPAASLQTPDPEETWRTRYESAMRTLERGQYAAAADQLQEIAPALQRLYGTKQADGIIAYSGLSIALFYSGQGAASDAAMTQALQWAKQLPEPVTQHHIAIAMARQLLHSNRIEAAAPLIQEAVAFFAAEPDAQRFAARAHLLQAELSIRRDEQVRAMALLKKIYTTQLQVFNGPHREMCATLTLQAIAADLAYGPAAALPLYRKARDLILQQYAESHPERVHAQLFLDYAIWRQEQSAAAQSVLRQTLHAYKQMQSTRADFGSLDVLCNGLLDNASATAAHDRLLALLNY